MRGVASSRSSTSISVRPRRSTSDSTELLTSVSSWYINLTVHPEAVVEVEGRTLRVRAEEMSDEDAAGFWPRVLATAPDYARYRARTSRVIPLLRLTPLEEQKRRP